MHLQPLAQSGLDSPAPAAPSDGCLPNHPPQALPRSCPLTPHHCGPPKPMGRRFTGELPCHAAGPRGSQAHGPHGTTSSAGAEPGKRRVAPRLEPRPRAPQAPRAARSHRGGKQRICLPMSAKPPSTGCKRPGPAARRSACSALATGEKRAGGGKQGTEAPGRPGLLNEKRASENAQRRRAGPDMYTGALAARGPAPGGGSRGWFCSAGCFGQPWARGGRLEKQVPGQPRRCQISDETNAHAGRQACVWRQAVWSVGKGRLEKSQGFG